ncbi:TIGR02587 family membrane protein [Oryzicola mucosus]|uniref:TIGR02587 family membrane protein n=1 Tax=Oryzicola mucosus TaxID=2767425 RepID=A0A8J6PS65_9HYPH|nr:TIGR02587 family membrane protein [Oryzicola mucosus]MBD0414074.1 TIGR02587 family membrane protein [Oryzicola mucosus]
MQRGRDDAKPGKSSDDASSHSRVLKDFGRAAGGALIFSLPILMTMEMWALGFTIDRARLLLLVVLALPLLVILSRHIGFEETQSWRDDILDALVALGVGLVVSIAILLLFKVLGPAMSLDEVVGKIALQAIPASIGALLAKSQFAMQDDDAAPKEDTYGGEMFLMAVGALFLGFNVAPTEEMVLISYQMTEWHTLAMVLLSLLVMHGFVFAVGFAGGTEIGPDTPWWSELLRLTIPGYLIALLISVYLLWTFGRMDDASLQQMITAAVVLGFPASVGAAAARLIL